MEKMSQKMKKMKTKRLLASICWKFIEELADFIEIRCNLLEFSTFIRNSRKAEPDF